MAAYVDAKKLNNCRGRHLDVEYVRITEKRRDAIAAAAIVQRIVSRSRPLVFLPVLPLKKGSVLATVIFGCV